MTAIDDETLRLSRLALYQLRQDVGVPETPEAAQSDTSLTWSKCRDALDVAAAEVLDAHNWTWKRGEAAEAAASSPATWPSDAKNALVFCLARELAVPIAGRVEDMKNMNALYAEKLRLARLHDLERETEAVSDPDMKEVLAVVCPTLTSASDALPMDLAAVTRRVEACRARARAAILAAHNWSFAREEFPVCGCPAPTRDANYPFSCDLPPKCARPLACYASDGRRCDWKLVGRTIRSASPVAAVLSLRNEERLDRWPPLCRAAYVARLAADVAATVAGSSAEARRLDEAAERALETARLADSRGSGTRREPRGRNFYADAMRGGTAPRRGGGPCRC